MQARTYATLDHRALLTVGGPDRAAFLQGLISNDIAKVAPDRAVYASLLTAQGRFLHDFCIVAVGDAYWLDVEAARRDDLKRRLTLYRLRAKVTIDMPNGFRVVALTGGDAVAALGLANEPGRAAPFAGGVAFVDPRLAALGLRAIVPEGAIADIERAGFAAGTPAAYDRLRYALGVPDGSRDLPVEHALLLENGFDELNGVDWKKGCYVGQELTARMKYRALVKKRLTPVRVEGPTPAPGTPIVLGDAEAGEMRSAEGDLGLAMLRLDAIEDAARSGRKLAAGAATLTPQKPAWAAS
ncbi:MAG: folate-binding protein YgfZ [Alphaproteobacteria bacterium]|nr:folate-binding protein YgfZ [Alphaproteobacteria bacterium]